MFLQKGGALMTTMSSREFNQDAGKAKRMAMQGPVFITDRGRLAHVLLTIEEYQKITATHQNMADMLACPESVDIDFDPVPLQKNLFVPADLS